MEETALKIRLFGDQALRDKARPVSLITDEHRRILSEMSQLMYASSGVGLAAPQIGVNLAMLVADAGSGLYKLINPVIIKKKGRQVLEEGCLSIPGICIKVKRAKKIVVKAQDENAQSFTIEADELLACVLQHEIDHLHGKLIVDYASLFKKIGIRKKLEVFKNQAKDENLPQSKTKSCALQL